MNTNPPWLHLWPPKCVSQRRAIFATARRSCLSRCCGPRADGLHFPVFFLEIGGCK